MSGKLLRYIAIFVFLICAIPLLGWTGLYVWYRLDYESFSSTLEEPVSEWHAKRFFRKMVQANPGWDNSGRDPISSIVETHMDGTPLVFFEFTTIYSPDFIWLSGEQVRNIEPLADYQLSHVFLTGVNVSDLSPLEDLPLQCIFAPVLLNLKDISPLKGAPLTDLDIDWAQVEDLSALSGNTTLQSINLSGTREKIWLH